MDGFIVVDKSAGMTSHDVVSAVRRIVGQKKVGHTGTLDPFATGVLPVALGEATKAIPFLDESIKEYRAVMKLGVATDTQDYTGKVLHESDWSHVTTSVLNEICRMFVGKLSQVPPMFSALKQNGVPLYKLARQGAEVPRQPREIEIYSLVIEAVNLPEVAFTVRCSRGTYVRTLANDIGGKLGCGAHLLQLHRSLSGPFSINNAITLDDWARRMQDGRAGETLVSPFAALSHLKDFILTGKGAAKVANGVVPALEDFQVLSECELLRDELVRMSFGGTLLAVAKAGLPGDWKMLKNLKLSRVFNLDNSFT